VRLRTAAEGPGAGSGHDMLAEVTAQVGTAVDSDPERVAFAEVVLRHRNNTLHLGPLRPVLKAHNLSGVVVGRRQEGVLAAEERFPRVVSNVESHKAMRLRRPASFHFGVGKADFVGGIGYRFRFSGLAEGIPNSPE
jgi:hypothetical protein